MYVIEGRFEDGDVNNLFHLEEQELCEKAGSSKPEKGRSCKMEWWCRCHAAKMKMLGRATNSDLASIDALCALRYAGRDECDGGIVLVPRLTPDAVENIAPCLSTNTEQDKSVHFLSIRLTFPNHTSHCPLRDSSSLPPTHPPGRPAASWHY